VASVVLNPGRALVVTAHPDDEMGAAGFVHRLSKAGYELHIVAMSDCSDLNGPSLIEEWVEACTAIGIPESNMEFEPFRNRNLPEVRQSILGVLEDQYAGQYWDFVLCPTTTDVHQDHGTVAQEVRRLFKRATVLGYELPVNSFQNTALSMYARLEDDDMAAKIAHSDAFVSQSLKPYMSHDYIEGLARVRGVQCGVRYAEAFEVIRWVL